VTGPRIDLFDRRACVEPKLVAAHCTGCNRGRLTNRNLSTPQWGWYTPPIKCAHPQTAIPPMRVVCTPSLEGCTVLLPIYSCFVTEFETNGPIQLFENEVNTSVREYVFYVFFSSKMWLYVFLLCCIRFLEQWLTLVRRAIGLESWKLLLSRRHIVRKSHSVYWYILENVH